MRRENTVECRCGANCLRFAYPAEAEKSFEDWRVGGLEGWRVGGLEGSRIKDKDGNSGLESEWATIME